jgi:hypothetical protein
MRRVLVFLLALGSTLVFSFRVRAQTVDSIWLTTSNNVYKTGESVIVTVNTMAASPLQGFTFQIRYDPACLKPVNATSPVPGMNGLPLPQASGLVDGTFASPTPQAVNGVLAEVYFQALAGCNTKINLESAALAVRNADGFAAPLPNVTILSDEVALNIDRVVKAPGGQSVQPIGANLPLEPTTMEITSYRNLGWVYLLVAGVLFLAAAGYMLLRAFASRKPVATRSIVRIKGNVPQRSGVTSLGHPISVRISPNENRVMSHSSNARMHFKLGPYAGQSFTLDKLPFSIGRDPGNDLCLNNPQILVEHAKIFETNNAYYLMDLGGETYVNGKVVNKNSARLKRGDVVVLGKSALFVFEF